MHIHNLSHTLLHTQAAATALAVAGQVAANATAALAEADAIATASAVAAAATTTAAQAQLVVDNAHRLIYCSTFLRGRIRHATSQKVLAHILT